MIEEIQKRLIQKYGIENDRYKHIIGVYNLATRLAIKYGVDVEKAKIAALLHDFYKNESIEELIDYLGKDIKGIEEYPFAYHAYASAKYAKEELNINDDEILNAIRNHVIGRKNMTLLEEIIFIADYCEETRKYEDCVTTRAILEKSLYKAIYTSILKTRNHLLLKGEKPTKLQNELCDIYYKKGNEL